MEVTINEDNTTKANWTLSTKGEGKCHLCGVPIEKSIQMVWPMNAARQIYNPCEVETTFIRMCHPCVVVISEVRITAEMNPTH